MITQRDKKVKEHLATSLHLNSHSATSLEGVAAADDEREIVSSKLSIIVRSVLVCPASGRQYGRDLNARLETLLPKGKTLQLIEPVLVGSTASERLDDGSNIEMNYLLDGSVLEDGLLNSMVVDGGLCASTIFELPCVLPLIVQESGLVVALV